MLDIRVRSRVEDERITVGSEERACNGGNLADEVWVNVVREEPSSHDVKLVADSQDRVSHAFLLDLSAAQRLAAKPQLPAKPSVTYYVFDDEYAVGVKEMLGTLPQVQSTYRIPALMVSGKRRFDSKQRQPYGYSEPTKPLSMKKLRLLRRKLGELSDWPHGFGRTA